MTSRKSTRTTTANISPTKEDKGVTLAVEVTAYDNTLITVDGRPMNRNGDQGQGYISAVATIAEKLWLLQRESAQRTVKRTPKGFIQDFNPINIDGD